MWNFQKKKNAHIHTYIPSFEGTENPIFYHLTTERLQAPSLQVKWRPWPVRACHAKIWIWDPPLLIKLKLKFFSKFTWSCAEHFLPPGSLGTKRLAPAPVRSQIPSIDGASVGPDTWPPANAIYQPSDNHILGKTYPHKDFSLLSQIIYKLFVKS